MVWGSPTAVVVEQGWGYNRNRFVQLMGLVDDICTDFSGKEEVWVCVKMHQRAASKRQNLISNGFVYMR